MFFADAAGFFPDDFRVFSDDFRRWRAGMPIYILLIHLFETKNEKRKKNRRKAKKTKESRMEFNYKAVLQMIAPQHEWSVEDPIHSEDLNLEAIAELSKHKCHALLLLFNKTCYYNQHKTPSRNTFLFVLMIKMKGQRA